MSERKNIDRLFQEKFKDFEATPATDLWGSIEAKLDQEKRRRVIPFWWKFSGVAAVFLIGFLLGEMVFNNDIAPTNPVVIDGASSSPERNETNTDKDIFEKNNPKSEATVDAIPKKDGTDVITPEFDKTANETLDAVVDKSNIKDQKSGGRTKILPIVKNQKTSVAQNKSGRHQNKLNQDRVKAFSKEPFEKNQGQISAYEEKESQKIADTNPLAQNDNDKNKSKETDPLSINKDINFDALKGENNSKIAIKEIENKINDTTKSNTVVKNELEELLKEKGNKLNQESKQNRWQLTSNIAPVFLGSASNGSPIDSTLVNNSKSYNTGVGFGLGVSYAVTKKLSVRAGLNKFNMSYNTNNIVYFAGIEARTLNNVKTTAAASEIQIENANVRVPVTSELGLLPFENSFVHKNKGYISQEMGYIEMPVEMTYALIDKRFGFKIIGGFSTLFLEDNSINVVSDNRSTFLGEASNLNDIHFSTNIGIGLKYGFMKSFELNVEPTFKYQINTFSSGAGNFKPYVFGIYSGISYKF